MHNISFSTTSLSTMGSESGSNEQMRAAKFRGAYYTPDAVAESLVKWVVRSPLDQLLDPACGDGRFLSIHKKSVGIESDPAAARLSAERAPRALVHEGDFFAWASSTKERFECAAGNPPFIRYQTFKGEVRKNALAICARSGAHFSGLASSWAPFIVATAALLKPGGRIAFVVPAEIGHAPYARPLIEYLVSHFGLIHLIAVKAKIFPDLSEDCWLLYAEDFGCTTSFIRLTVWDNFRPCTEPPKPNTLIDIDEWRRDWSFRLRPFLLPKFIRLAYKEAANHPGTTALGEIADVGIGYVTGDNDFFHLRPSEAAEWNIPRALLHTAVRNGRVLPRDRLNTVTVEKWWRENAQMLLLRLPNHGTVPPQVRKYLATTRAQSARQAFKCRTREPWYSVPDVVIPDLFMSYMSGAKPLLVANDASCVCTNSVHAVRLKRRVPLNALIQSWQTPFAELSCEIEGHPLGGGMLKIEPREAARIRLLGLRTTKVRVRDELIAEGIHQLREWRHIA